MACFIDKYYAAAVDKNEKYGIIKTEGVETLEQAKKRDHKIYITDVAIDKVSRSDIPYLTQVQNDMIYINHISILKISQTDNDSNEVASLLDLYTNESAVSLGDEHEVNVFLNPNAVSMSDHAEDGSLFLAHNHPSTQDFSYSDLGVFLMNDSIGGLSVVSNTGDVHILFKSEKYNFARAYELMASIKSQYDSYDSEVDRLMVKEFLKNSKTVGIMQF